MTHTAIPEEFESPLTWAFLHPTLPYGLLHPAVDGPEGQWFAQITAGERIHHLADADDSFDFVRDILEIAHEARDGGR
ncbi:hypothetical protein [Streptomyces sp. NPDC018045]|uniref:hypothetical protein n=1 Tax=Streptomyces sp. NPDC018045 TaxID=3365037 RepID=UPI00378FF71E